MKNKLIFEGNTEDKTYQWGKFNIASGKHYRYSKHEIDSTNKYNWNTYNVNQTGTITHIWNKYNARQIQGYYTWSKDSYPATFIYNWDRYSVIPAGNIAYEWPKYKVDYNWDKFTLKTVPKYKYQYKIEETFETLDYNGSKEVEIGTVDMQVYQAGTKYAVGIEYKDQSLFNTETGVQTPGSGYGDDRLIINRANDLKNFTNLPINGIFYEALFNIGQPHHGPFFNILTRHQIDSLDIYQVNVFTGFHPKAGVYTSAFKSEYGNYNVSLKFVKINGTQCKVMAKGIRNYDVSYTRVQIGTEQVKGDFITSVKADNDSQYPKDGIYSGNWYVYMGFSPGDYIESVKDTNPDAHPSGAVAEDGFYYGNRQEKIAGSDQKGELIGSVSSRDFKAYPENSIQNGYWYIYKGERMESQYYIDANYLDSGINIRNSYIYMTKTKPTLNNRYNNKNFTFVDTISVSIPYSIDDSFIQTMNNYIQNGYKYFRTNTTAKYYEITNKTELNYNGYFSQLSEYYADIKASGVIYDASSYQGIMASNSSYYQKTSSVKIYQKLDYVNQVSSGNRKAYPDNNYQDGFWYIYEKSTDTTAQSKGSFIGVVSAYNLDTYPQDAIYNGIWYEYKNYENELSAGIKLEDIYTNEENKYPQNGALNGYWYILQETSTEQYRGEFVDFVTNKVENTYPKDGIQGSYWYVFFGLVAQDIYTITDTELMEGVHYKSDINPDNDYAIGVASCAQITFKISNQNNDAQKYNDLLCRYYCKQGNETDWTLVGKFRISSCNINASTAELTGFDNISNFDIYIDDWIKKQKFPITLKDMFESLCLYCGCSFKNTGFINQDYMVKDNFTAINITGRQILQYIAQASGGFAIAQPDGTISLSTYYEPGTVLDNKKYVKLEQSTYEVEPIDKLIIQMTEKDTGITIGTGSNVYKITNNPLFFADTPEEIQKPAQNIFNVIRQAIYTPMKIELLEDYNINCGDIITINGKKSYVMSKTIEPKGIKLESVGNQYRQATGEETNSDIVALRGKYNELKRDLTTTQSTIGDVKTELESQITQTANEINATVSYQGEIITQVKQNVDGINLSYNAVDGTASLTIGGITVSQLTDKGYVDKTVAGIELTGYVKFNDLKNEGSTIINGKNIISGTITADNINLTGAVTWGDLSEGAKSTIIQYAEEAGAQAGNVPKYIQQTYIDKVEIRSPSIYGAEIYAGTSTDGYIKMSSTGLNFCSKNGGTIMGMGYYASKYALPYMVFGAGVDSYGTDRGLIKKYSTGIWIGDSDGITSDTPKGTGLFINFDENKIYKYINGAKTAL